MRAAVQFVLAQLPDPGHFRIGEFEPPVATEHRDAFVKLVQRLALDFDQGIERTLQCQAIGDVLHREDQPAQRMR